MTWQSPATMTHPECFASQANRPPADWTAPAPHHSARLYTRIISQPINNQSSSDIPAKRRNGWRIYAVRWVTGTASGL